MKECFYCGKEFDEDDTPINGYDDNHPVIACQECEEIQENFIRNIYFKDEIYKRFAIQYVTSDDPCSIKQEYIVRQTFSEAFEYAQENYTDDELVGIMFDEYVNVHGKDLVYNSKTNSWCAF